MKVIIMHCFTEIIMMQNSIIFIVSSVLCVVANEYEY